MREAGDEGGEGWFLSPPPRSPFFPNSMATTRPSSRGEHVLEDGGLEIDDAWSAQAATEVGELLVRAHEAPDKGVGDGGAGVQILPGPQSAPSCSPR
jgi:hypothetical protein